MSKKNKNGKQDDHLEKIILLTAIANLIKIVIEIVQSLLD